MRRPLSILGGAVVAWALMAAGPAYAQGEPQSLDALLEQVKRGWSAERAENQRREAEFRQRRAEQQSLLKQARSTRAKLEARSDALERRFEENEIQIAELEELLANRLGNLGELFGVVRQVAGDTRGHVESSLVSAQIQGREPFLEELGKSKRLPSVEYLERLWYTLLQEMRESGRVVRFPATVVTTEGDEVERQVARAGVFNAVADGKYLRWLPEVGKLAELGRQPAARYLSTAGSFERNSNGGLTTLAVDPSRGAILSLLVQTPGAGERIEQGGVVGYAIIALGSVTGLLALLRLGYVLLVGRKVKAQQAASVANEGNPLGRVLKVFEEHKEADTETLELKLDEAVLRETASLERFLWLIKVVSVVAPLMGLLGTVTGMIQTFQAITLFGTGDPKLMAGGISEALVTTMLGLCVAIPLVLLHSIVSSTSQQVVEVLDEQSAGMIARRAEQEGGTAIA